MEGTACGKVILLGEHAVVYGVPAIAVGIHRGASARAGRLEEGPSVIQIGTSATVAEDDPSDLGRAFAAVLRVSPEVGPVRVEAHTDLPAQAGLGCSAALGVAVARALDALSGGDAAEAASPAVVAERAGAWEGIFHGNASGIDAAAAARGGSLLFTRASGQTQGTIEPIRLGGSMSLVIGHTGIAASTRGMVEGVARLRERRPELVEKSFEGIRSLVQNARLAIEAGDFIGLGRLMNLNQMLLSGLMLSTEETERMCDLARGAGALGAKLTGGGGGGCVVALVAQDPEPVLAAWRGEGFEGFATLVGPVPQSAGTANVSDASPHARSATRGATPASAAARATTGEEP